MNKENNKLAVTYRSARDMAAKQLEQAGVPDAAYDAASLLEFVTGMNRASYFLHQGDEVPAGDLVRFQELVDKRAARIPLQHLIGETCFMGLPFKVSSDVLVPRQDTEKLVETVLEDFLDVAGETAASGEKPSSAMSLLDMCTGSGCIAISLARMAAFARVDAVDISPAALALAGQNAELNLEQAFAGRFKLLQSDLFAAVSGRKYDIITSNPPYIPEADVEELMPEVRDHDPRIALVGGEDGLVFYRQLAAECPGHLYHGGRVYFEIGYDQGEAVSSLLTEAGFSKVCIIKDDAGMDRVVMGVWN